MGAVIYLLVFENHFIVVIHIRQNTKRFRPVAKQLLKNGKTAEHFLGIIFCFGKSLTKRRTQNAAGFAPFPAIPFLHCLLSGKWTCYSTIASFRPITVVGNGKTAKGASLYNRTSRVAPYILPLPVISLSVCSPCGASTRVPFSHSSLHDKSISSFHEIP